MVEFNNFIEITVDALKSGREVSFKDESFRNKLSGDQSRLDKEGNRNTKSQYCRAIGEWANDYFRTVCQSKQKTIYSLFDNSKPDACVPADIPFCIPSLTLRWADSPLDQLETEDIETFCLTARNPYSNLTFNNFQISTSILIDPNWMIPPNNNDGTPSSKFTPAHKICFGDLGPCSSSSREIQLVNRNALPGRYYWIVAFCVNWSVSHEGIGVFPLDYELS